MFSKPQIHHKPTRRPNFEIIPPPFDMKKTCPTSHHPQNCLKTIKLNFKNTTKKRSKFGKPVLPKRCCVNRFKKRGF